jgi:hypothetical protein
MCINLVLLEHSNTVLWRILKDFIEDTYTATNTVTKYFFVIRVTKFISRRKVCVLIVGATIKGRDLYRG